MLSLVLRHASKELKTSITFLQRRTFMFRVKTSEKAFRRKDIIDESFSIIYKAPMELILVTCNYLTTTSALIFGAFAVYSYIHRFEPVSTERVEVEYTGGMAAMSDDEYVYFAIGLVGFCIAIRMILHKYPLRIYRNQSKWVDGAQRRSDVYFISNILDTSPCSKATSL